MLKKKPGNKLNAQSWQTVKSNMMNIHVTENYIAIENYHVVVHLH